MSAAGDVSKNRKQWAAVKQTAQQRLAGLGGKLMDSPHAYEIARWMHPDLTLIFYQHKTSAGNYHARVRAGYCANRETLRKAIFALAENSCQFQFPSEQQWHNEAVSAAIRRERTHCAPSRKGADTGRHGSDEHESGVSA